MNSKRIEQIQKGTSYPHSVSVQQALFQVWNECEQEYKSKAEKVAKEQFKALDKNIRQHSIDFVEWCMREKYTYYFNGKEWMWGHSMKQEYYTTDELYEKFVSESIK